jgi:prevent-host-death family protein
MRTMAAGKFKAQCLAVLDEVKTKREGVVVTKNGKPFAKLVPLDAEDDDPLAVFRFPGLKIVGDIMSPLYTDEETEAFMARTERQVLGEEE